MYDVQGNVVAVVDGDGEVQERYRYDVQGNVEYLDDGFARKPVQDTSFAWQHLFGGLRLDVETGLYFGGGYYHAGLGRLLPSGAVSVFSEAYLNSRASGFPFGTPQPPGASQAARSLMYLASKYEQLAQWISEQSPWIKYTLGTGLLVGTAIGVTAYTIATGGVNPHAWLAVAGAIAGAVGGGIEASLAGGDFSDVILSAGIGAVFGAICPPAAIGGLAGGGIAALGAYALGGDPNTIATAYQWGSLVGGLAGDFTGGALTAGKFLSMRALRAGVTHVGPDLLGAGVGAIIGYSLDGTSTSALHGANLGMMAGGIAGGAIKSAWARRSRRLGAQGSRIPHTAIDFSPDYVPRLASEGRVIFVSANLPSKATIEEVVNLKLLPGFEGVTITDRTVVFSDLWRLTALHEREVEFKLCLEVLEGRRVFRLYSGGRGFVEYPTQNLIRGIAHTHPSGNPSVSPQDIASLNRQWLKYFRSMNNPYVTHFPSRVVYGPGPDDYTLYWPTVLR